MLTKEGILLPKVTPLKRLSCKSWSSWSRKFNRPGKGFTSRELSPYSKDAISSTCIQGYGVWGAIGRISHIAESRISHYTQKRRLSDAIPKSFDFGKTVKFCQLFLRKMSQLSIKISIIVVTFS